MLLSMELTNEWSLSQLGLYWFTGSRWRMHFGIYRSA